MTAGEPAAPLHSFPRHRYAWRYVPGQFAPQYRLLPQVWRDWYTALLEYPGIMPGDEGGLVRVSFR